MKSWLIFVIILTEFCFVDSTVSFLQKSKDEILELRNNISQTNTFEQGKADLIFLLDESGSLSITNFYDEKRFVRNLLNNIFVAKEATRVEVIPFATKAERYIDYISNLNHDLEQSKCTFNVKFGKLEFWSGLTNMHDAFKLAYEVVGGKDSGAKRKKNVLTVLILISDGLWNEGGDPAKWANKLKSLKTEIFTVAVGAYTVHQTLKSLATSSEHAFYLSNFDQFKELAVYIRGGKFKYVFRSKVVQR